MPLVPWPVRGLFVRPGRAALRALLLTSSLLAGCGQSPGAQEPGAPFLVAFPPGATGTGGGGSSVPPVVRPKQPLFAADAFVHGRSVLFGSFPSDVVLFEDTAFASDADQVEAAGAAIVPVDVSGATPLPSQRFRTVLVLPQHLVDSTGAPADAAAPIGFGFFLNEIRIVGEHLGLVLANAGGSDSTPALSNLIAFDPTNGIVLQTVNLAVPFSTPAPLTDSSGAPVPGGTFLQSGAEGLEVAADGAGGLRVFVAMTNLLFGAPSFGQVKLPGTVQVFDLTPGLQAPVAPVAGRTLLCAGYNPGAVQRLRPDGGGRDRVLVTVTGATAFDATGALVPVTDASVEAYDADGTFLGRFLLGLSGLSSIRPALGRDGAGSFVGFFPSSTTGRVYLLRLDGLTSATVDEGRLAVLRGPDNGIPITAAGAGSPGGNVTGIGLSPDGRTLVVAGFGNLFAFPAPEPGRLFLLDLPPDVVTGAGFGVNFVPGSTEHATVAGRTLGALVLVPNAGERPDVLVNVSGPFDTTTFVGTGPASLGTLRTYGRIR
jgi:hypothetical protein